MDRTAAKWTEWAANKPSAAEMANFQESVATEAYEALKKEFADILNKMPPAR
jgi:flagellar motility protein MotE (MotC chaperone)